MVRAKRLLLLSCRSPFLDDSKVYCPLANLYLKSYVNQHLPDIDVLLRDDDYDLEDMSWIDGVDAVGISIMTPQRNEALRIAAAIKRARPEVIVIGGGPHVRHYCADLEGDASFDFLVPQDGEKALVEIIAGSAHAKIVSSVLSRQEIALQPRPDRTSEAARRVILGYHYLLDGQPSATMMTARGCPEHCTFCEDALTTVKWSSLTNINAELDDIASLGYRGVYIFDDLFTLSLHTMRPICEALSDHSLIFRCNAQARYFTKWGDQMAALLAAHGCREIAFGAESGSQTILDAVQKRCTVEQNYNTVAYAKKHGLHVKAFILIGLPGETRQTLADTEAFVRDSGIDDFQCAVYMPFRGTQIRRAIERGQQIDLVMLPQASDNDVTGAYGIAGGETSYEVRTAALSPEDLRAFRNHLVARYKPTSHRTKWAEDRFFEQAELAHL